MLSDADAAALRTRLMVAMDYLGDGLPPDAEHVERAIEMAAVLIESAARSMGLSASQVAPWCAARLARSLEMRGVYREILPAAFEERLLRAGRRASGRDPRILR